MQTCQIYLLPNHAYHNSQKTASNDEARIAALKDAARKNFFFTGHQELD